MSTLSSEINDLFLMRVKDYRLDSIYNSSGSSAFNIYLEPWILDSIDDFDICNQDLTYVLSTATEEGYFTTTLTSKNKNILSQIMVKYWLANSVSNILQMDNLIQDHDFKTFAQANNLKAKQDYLSAKKEEISQLLVDYDYKNNDWASWRNQTFA